MTYHDLKQSKTLTTASLTLGLLSLPTFIMPYFGLPFALLAITFGVLSENTEYSGRSTTGIIFGFIGFFLNLATGLLALAFL